MPENDIALEPNKRKPLKVTLSGYDDLPEDKRPVFKFKRLSFRKFREVADVYDTMDENSSAAEALGKIAGVLKPALLGWENAYDFDGKPVAFDREKLEDVVEMDEGKQLLKGLMEGGVDGEARKN